MAKSPIYNQIRRLIREISLDIINTKGGYSFWHNLNEYKKETLLKCWSKSLHDGLFTLEFRKAALKASLTQAGTPTLEGRLLFNWLLKEVYNGNAQQLYWEWNSLKKDD